MKVPDDVLTLKHYKEPLLPVPKNKGFGYYGAISISLKDEEKMQCHKCGLLFHNVARHALNVHELTARQYKEKFQLAYLTALVSEPERQKMKDRAMRYLAGLSDAQKKQMRDKAIRLGRKWQARRNHQAQPKGTLEQKNKRGTCPDQLLQRVKTCMEELGHQPSKAEFIDWCDGSQRFTHIIRATFGSWGNMLKMLGLSQKTGEGKTKRHCLSDEELLESLSIYAQEFGRIPSYTDCKRNLLPGYEVYTRRFGTFEKARVAAGVYTFVNRDTLGRWGKKSLAPHI